MTRQAALAFTRRTLARCQKFDDTGLSCFADPALRDILFSSPSNDAKSSENGGSGTASNTLNEPSNHQAEAKGSGMQNLNYFVYKVDLYKIVSSACMKTW